MIESNDMVTITETDISIEFAIIDYLVTKCSTQNNKFKLSNKLLEYHKDFINYLHNYNNNYKNNKKPLYENYVNLLTPQPKSIDIENAIYKLLEGGCKGLYNGLFIAKHNIQKINYLLFRIDGKFILIYSKNDILFDFKIVS